MALVRIGGSAELQLPSARIYAALCSSNLPLCKQILTDLLRSIIDLFLCFNPLKITNKLNRIRHISWLQTEAKQENVCLETFGASSVCTATLKTGPYSSTILRELQ